MLFFPCCRLKETESQPGSETRPRTGDRRHRLHTRATLSIHRPASPPSLPPFA